MKRRLLTLLAVLLMLLSMALPMALASEAATEETVEETTEETTSRYSTATSGSCGKNVTWRLDGHTLTITGSGEIDSGSPWEFYKDSIYTLVLNGDITVIGDEAFSTCNNLQYIDFGDALVEIGYQAFYSCNALEAIRLPASFRKFGPECFRDCSGLQVVYCEGPMPSFKGSCLYTDHTVSVFYSHKTPWPYEEVERLMSNFGSRLYVDVGTPEVLEDYLDDSDFPAEEAETTAPTEAPTEPTVPETTVPPTTVPVQTEPAAVPTEIAVTPAAQADQEQTEPVFQLESEPLFVTEPEPVSQAVETGGFSGWFWVLIAAAVITGILILALLIRMVSHSGGRYED